MKKLITGAVAALALLFGFASCSGDLHDSEVAPLYVAGDIQADKNTRGEFTMVSDTEQRYSFTYDSSTMTYWGGASGTVNFKVTRDADGWAKDWGGKQDTAIELSVNGKDALELNGRDAANSNPGNIKIYDLADGNTYTLIVTYDAPSEAVSIKCTGNVTDYPGLQAVIVDDTNGAELTKALGKQVLLTRSGTDYTSSTFTPTKDGSVTYYLTNGYLYWGSDGVLSTSVPTTYYTGSWTYNSEHSDWAYAVYADASDFADSQKITSKILIPDTSILGKADIIGTVNNWGSDSLSGYKVDDTTYEYTFTFVSASWLEDTNTAVFSIREIAGSWDSRWCGDLGNGDGSKFMELRTTDSAKEMVYTSEWKDPAHVHIKGLTEGSKYTITITITDASSKKITCSVKAAK